MAKPATGAAETLMLVKMVRVREGDGDVEPPGLAGDDRDAAPVMMMETMKSAKPPGKLKPRNLARGARLS